MLPSQIPQTSNPNVRSVINNVGILGAKLELQSQLFLQPIIGEIIYFLDGISGIVKQVIINPDNRRVIAITIQGRFADHEQEIKSMNSGGARCPQRLIVLSMNVVCYLTNVSGFLNISSDERKEYTDFDPTHFFIPNKDWQAPYPYCLGDVLFPIEGQDVEDQILQVLPQSLFAVAVEEPSLVEQLAANDSLGS